MNRMRTRKKNLPPSRSLVNWPLFLLTAGFVLLFCLITATNMPLLSRIVDAGFQFSTKYFGFFWQCELLINFIISMIICFLPGSKSIMGKLQKPEFSIFQWGSMIICTLLAGGGVFWAAGEPISHFLSPPPLFNAEPGSETAISVALAQSFLHWGFTGWAILGSTGAIILMYYHYEKGLPLAPRTLLYPIFGKYAIKGPIGLLADAASVIAVLAGTVGPIGFVGLQVSYGLHELFGLPDSLAIQVATIIFLVSLYTFSSVTGIQKGIQFLSRLNVILAGLLLTFMLLAGPTLFIFKSFFSGLYTYLTHFFSMALYRGNAGLMSDDAWLNWWTLFFWGWFIGYGPMMAMFIAKISRGRSIRSIIIMLAIIAPLVTNFWFTILGGSGIALEFHHPGSIANAFQDNNLPAALLATTTNFPFGFVLSLLFIVLTSIFAATTGASMTYTISVSMSKNGKTTVPIRLFWGLTMGIMAISLIYVGAGSIDKLQSFIVITAVPVSLILAPAIWDAVRITHMKSRQKITKSTRRESLNS